MLRSDWDRRTYAKTTIRGKVDDVTGVVLLHHRQTASNSVEHSLTVDIHSAVPFIHVPVLQEIDRHVSGIVDLHSHSNLISLTQISMVPKRSKTKSLKCIICLFNLHPSPYFLFLAHIHGASDYVST